MTSLRNRLFPALAAAFVIAAIAVASCTSDNKTSVGTDESTTTTTTVVGGATTTTTAGATTTAGSATTAPPTTVKHVTATTKPPTTSPPATNPPPTNPPTTPAPQIFTSFSVSDAYACTDPTATYQPPPPSVTISWTVVGADSVQLKIDGGLWGSYGLSGSETLPASCNSMHNVHTYSAVAIKNGQAIATKSATKGF